MQQEIERALDSLEASHNIRILYACESGSRAWGFASPDSDYDIRFIYARRVESYLSILEPRDVLELPEKDLLDISGWDLRKALQLFMTSNCPLYEWLQSPVVYRQAPGFLAALHSLMPEFFSLRAGCHHYSSMARKTIAQDLSEDPLKLKKYFYALRPALAALWIIRKQEIPPMEFETLRTIEDDLAWQQQVDDLLAVKAVSGEKTLVHPVPVLDTWLTNVMKEVDAGSGSLLAKHPIPDKLNEVFRKWIH